MILSDKVAIKQNTKLLGVACCIYCLLAVNSAFAKSHDLDDSNNNVISPSENIAEINAVNREQPIGDKADSSTGGKSEQAIDSAETLQGDVTVPVSEPGPVEETVNTSGNTAMYIGIGAVALGVVALGLAGGGSGSSASATEVTETPVGPDLNGTWTGTLNLVNYGSQSVSATITHSGTSLTIKTNSAFSYAKEFSGSISSSGYITVWDADTGQEWTTHYGKASSSSVKLYDYVNNFTALDKLILYK